MTQAQKVNYLKRQIQHDRTILRFFKHHPQIRTVERRHSVHFARVSLPIATAHLRPLLAPTYAVGGSDMAAWMCIHRQEGAWNDPGSPYWGGLQMDLSFQQTYGSEFLRKYGTADHWPIAVQILVARRARDGYGRYKARGYSPWPNTARNCGLL